MVMETKHCSVGILFDGQKTLMAKRSANRKFYPDVWDFAGGHCEDQETPKEALVRELKEELDISPIDFSHFKTICKFQSNLNCNYEFHLFLVRRWDGIPKNVLIHEHSEIRWLSITDAIKLSLAHPEYPEILKSLELL
jgi:mutator protein MutT